eukprot:7168406-Pyramimonas_sp.AAC.1
MELPAGHDTRGCETKWAGRRAFGAVGEVSCRAQFGREARVNGRGQEGEEAWGGGGGEEAHEARRAAVRTQNENPATQDNWDNHG